MPSQPNPQPATRNPLTQTLDPTHLHAGLFNLREDPLESVDLASSMPGKVAELYAKIERYEATAFNPDRGGVDPNACTMAMEKYGGFWGPFVFP